LIASSPSSVFVGLRKTHLNNSVEDPSYLNELLGGEIFQSAGIPAARTTHTLVELNGRPLGLYVLKEGFTEDFLALHFGNPSGRLYEPGNGHDVNEALDQKLGNGATNRAGLDALAAAALESNLQQRWHRLQQALDVDRFISFMALEVMLAHRDGYCLARNNFRVYDDPADGKIVFLPHGMDQLFGSAPPVIEPSMNGLVARALMENPGRARALSPAVRITLHQCVQSGVAESAHRCDFSEAERGRCRKRTSANLISPSPT
jgi:spore coat protein CotH